MSTNINAFEQAPVTGQLDNGYDDVIQCQVSENEGGTLSAGDKVKIEDTAGGVPKILQIDDDTDEVFGVVVLDRKQNEYVAGDNLQIAIGGSLIWQVAGAAIARGAQVEVVASSQKVITSAGVNTVIGYAFDKASADTDLIRVFVKGYGADLNNVIKVATVTATLSEINAGKVAIPATTGKSIKVLDYVASVTGTFTTTTSVDLQDESATVVTALAQADISDGAKLVPADGALGAGFGVALTVSESLDIVNTGSTAAGGTSIEFAISYILV